MERRVIGSVGAVVAALAVALAAGGRPATAQGTEGEVVVYTAAQSTIVQAIGPMFEKKTGIKVSFVEAGTGEILKRARAEAANPLGDVLWALGAEGMAANADLLEPYTVADDAKIAAIYKKGMAGGRITPNNVTPMVIVHNTKLLPAAEAPKTWRSLADPRWKDKIAYAAADKSGSSYTILATLLTVFGNNDAGWKVVESVMTNAKILPSSSRVPKGVADGEYQAGLTYEDAAMRQVKGGAPVGVIYPQDGTSIPPDGNGILFSTVERTNVWVQPLSGEPPARVTDLATLDIVRGRRTPDGKSLIVARGSAQTDAYLVSNFR